jgi:predicted GNAT superfamily acetyltransferase
LKRRRLGGDTMPTFQIRALKRLEEFRACENIQMAVWGNLAVGSELMSVTAKYGGAVIGALAGGKVIGFIYASLARRHGRVIHWSHMMAVEVRYRDRGLGFRMKLAHRRLALSEGVPSICWTYDPLQSRNAALNIHRLGGTVDEYIVNCYGRFPSRIEKGLPSDRFVVDWRVGSAKVAARLGATRRLSALRGEIPRANETRVNAQGFLENRKLHLGLRAPRIAVEIPPNPDAIRARDLRLAGHWRLETRKIFQSYFSRRYRVAEFVSPGPENAGRGYYVLARP